MLANYISTFPFTTTALSTVSKTNLKHGKVTADRRVWRKHTAPRLGNLTERYIAQVARNKFSEVVKLVFGPLTEPASLDVT